MFYSILRQGGTSLPPLLISAETLEGLYTGICEKEDQGWECVFAVEGERLCPDLFNSDNTKEVNQ